MAPRLALAAAAATLVAMLPGAAEGGAYVPPPGDREPSWSLDGSQILFFTSRGGSRLVAIPAGGGEERTVFEGLFHTLSPDWRWISFTRYGPEGPSLRIVRPDGSGERLLVAQTSLTLVTLWSPDSRRIAFQASDEALAVVDVDDGDVVRLAPAGYPSGWSPDGAQIMFAGGAEGDPDLYVVDSSGASPPRLLAGGRGAQMEGKWSPDGSRIAFQTQRDVGKPVRFGVVRSDGTGLVTYPGPGVTNYGSFAWLPSSDGIVFSRNVSQGVFRLDLDTGRTTRLTSVGAMPVPSPDGGTIAFMAGGECRDRLGIYVVRSDGASVRRLTNDCRIRGTAGDDVLRGTGLADVLLGFAGRDRISGLSAGYIGDTLLGGAGDDVLVGTFSLDLLHGGAGVDRIFGGLSADVIYGGGGRDHIDAQRGRDLVHARDGERDVVLCGTNFVGPGGTPERDEAWLDRIDVARGCEIVHRPRR
jgi:WD40 repeat protein